MKLRIFLGCIEVSVSLIHAHSRVGIKDEINLSAVAYEHIQGVMALTLFEDFVYWTDGKSKSLRRAHKTTGAQGMELLNSWQAIKSIKVYHSLRQPEGAPSVCLLRLILSHMLSSIWLSSYVLRSFSS